MADAVDEPIRSSNPLRRYLVPALVRVLPVVPAVGARAGGAPPGVSSGIMGDVPERGRPETIVTASAMADHRIAAVTGASAPANRAVFPLRDRRDRRPSVSDALCRA